MQQIDKNWLREHGVEGDDATLDDVVHHAEAALEMLVGDAIAQELSDEQLGEFEQLLDDKVSEKSRQKWLEQNYPNYQKVVEQVTADFKKDIAASEHPITFILEQQI